MLHWVKLRAIIYLLNYKKEDMAMKKLIIFLLVTLLSVSLLFSCAPAENGGVNDGTGNGGAGEVCEHFDMDKDCKCDFCGEDLGYFYKDFSVEDRALFTHYIGTVIPFVPNNEYYIEGYYEEDDYEHGICFYTKGNTLVDFEMYRTLFTGYALTETTTDEYGDIWYTYEKNDVVIDMAFLKEDGISYIYVYVYSSFSTDIGGGSGDHYYTDFTDEEKALFMQYIGAIIPFAPNDEYYVEGYYEETDYENGMYFAALGITDDEFNDYLGLYSDYEFLGSEIDEDYDIWYNYAKDGVEVSIVHYEYEGVGVIEVFVISELSNAPDDGGNGGSEDGDYLYNDFTSSEKALFEQYIGVEIPFLPCDDYAVEGYYEETDYENGMYFGAYYVTEANVTLYRALLEMEGYTLYGTEQDSYGDTWYTYTKGDVVIDVVYYVYEGIGCMDLFIYSDLSSDNGGGSDDNGGNGGSEDGGYLYNDFTSSEKALFEQYIGVKIPFMPCDEYYVEGYYEETDYENGMFFGAYYVTSSDFTAYRALFVADGYTLYGTEKDADGDTWYTYVKNDVVVDMVYYESEGIGCMELLIYSDLSSDNGGDSGDSGDSGNQGGSGNGSSSTTPEGNELLTNNGAGLPTDSDGVYDVDFTLGTPVKDVTEQGYYIDGCPATGSPAVLVIPVEFSDVTAASKGYSLDKINKAFLGASGTTDYYSVYEYYKIASYGQLDLDITVLDFWFKPQNKSTYYARQYEYEDGYQYFMGDQMILDEALAYLSTIMDLSAFDSDNNGIIDAVILINTLEIGEDDFYWAYRYWNYYTDSRGDYYEYDGVSANDYVWASYQFLHERAGSDRFDDTNAINTYTYIHEFAHILGADDYYDLSYTTSPLDGHDMMDSECGDHSPYTKFNLGWITTSRLVVANGSITLSLESFGKSGDTIIIANNWDAKLGAYQEYYVIMYYTNDGLNAGEFGFFNKEGVVVYHINASLYVEEYEGEIYYDVYYNNTPAGQEYGTEHNLIELVESRNGDYVFEAGESLGTVTDDSGNKLCYSFTVDSVTEDGVTVTFTKN